MTEASPNDWIVLELPDGIERATLARLARRKLGVLREELPAIYSGQPILLGDPARYQLPSGAVVLTEAQLSKEYFVGATLAERIAALHTAMASGQDWTRWSGAVAVLDSCPEDDLAALIAEVERLYAHCDDSERTIHIGWLMDAVEGDCRRANIARKLWLGDDRPEAIRAVRWLAEDRSRLPALRIWDITVKQGFAEWVMLAAKTREFEHLALRGEPKQLADVLSCVGPACRGIGLDYGPENGSALKILLSSPAWDSLRRLSVYKSLGKSKGVDALLASNKRTPLTHLDAGYNQLDKTTCERLLAWPMLDGLTHLELKYNDGRTNVAKAVASSPMFAQLELLDLSANEIGDPGLNAIAKSANWPRLHTLALAGNHKKPLITDKSIANFVKNKSFVSLKFLDLNLNQLGDSGFALLMQAQHLPAIETINVQFNGITLAGVEQLAGKEAVLKPRVLKLYSNKLGKGRFGVAPKPASKTQYDGGPWRYAHWLRNVVTLELGSCDLETDDLADICHSETLSSLTTLEVGSNYSLSNDAIAVLARSPLASRLKHVNMTFNPIGDGVAELLASSPLASGLSSFSIAQRDTSESELPRLRKLLGSRLSVI